MSEGQFGDWAGERGTPRKEELLAAQETHPFEVSQKADPARLGITTLSQPPPVIHQCTELRNSTHESEDA